MTPILPMKRVQMGPVPAVDQTTSIVVGGDFCPVGRFGDCLDAGREIFHPALVELFQTSYSLLNLETPLCRDDVPADSPSGVGLRGAPAVADYLGRLGIDAVSMANNHARDFGDEGIRQTMANLDAGGIRHTGAGETIAEAEQPLELTLDGIKVTIWALAEKELNLADDHRGGTAFFHPERNLPVIARLKERCDVLLIVVHAGHEFISIPSPRIRDAYRAFIDTGADAVIAHHPHVIQGVERHGHGFIAYSLGNLVFDTPYVSRYDDTDSGYLVRLNLAASSLNSVDIIPYQMTSGSLVAPLTAAGMAEFERRLAMLSDNISDNARFRHEWEQAVAFRWTTEYRRILSDFSRNLNCPGNPDYARRSRNLFTCPTHVEMIESIFLMLESGALAWEPAGR